MNFRFVPLEFAEAEPVIIRHLHGLPAPVDSFFEDHVSRSRHYQIQVDGTAIGWAAVLDEALITQFGLFPPFRRLGQQAYVAVRRLEQVREALVPTCDEFFLSHALDQFRRLETQAYQFYYDAQVVRSQPPSWLALRLATVDDLPAIGELAGSFFDDPSGAVERSEMNVALRGGDYAGFGVMGVSQLTPGNASIGMFTVESFRNCGVGTAVIAHLIDLCLARDLRPVAGCWFYNHNSRKTLEKAGMVSQTRLLRIYY